MTNVHVDVIARDRGMSRTFDKVGDSADKAGGKMAKLSRVLGRAAMGGALGLTVAAVGLAGEGLFAATKAALADDSAQKNLAKTLRNAAGARQKDVKSVEGWISKQGQALGVTDDELRPAMGRLVAATEDVGRAQKLASLGMDVSAGTGKSLKQVTEALAKAENGQVAGLSRLGVATKDANGETKSFAQIQGELQKKFGGQASTAAGSLEGKMGRLKLVFDETGESIGSKLIPPLGHLTSWLLSRGVPMARAWWAFYQKWYFPVFRGIGSAIGGLVDHFRAAGDDSSQFRQRLGTVASAVMRVARTVGENLKPVFVAIGGVIREKVVPLVAQMRTKFEEWRPTISKVLVIGGKLVGWMVKIQTSILGKVLPPLLKFAAFLVVGLVKSLVAVVDKGIKVTAWLIALPKKVQNAWDRTKKFAAFLRDSFAAILGKVGKAGKTLGDKVWSGIKQIGKTLSGIGGWIWGKWKQGNQTLYGRVKSMAASAGGRIWSGVTSIGPKLATIGGWAWDKFKGGLGRLKDKFTGAGKSLTRGMVSGLRSVWGTVKDQTKKPLEGIISRAINPFISAVNKVIPGTKHDLPTIKGFARGGRVSGDNRVITSVPGIPVRLERLLLVSDARNAGGRRGGTVHRRGQFAHRPARGSRNLATPVGVSPDTPAPRFPGLGPLASLLGRLRPRGGRMAPPGLPRATWTLAGASRGSVGGRILLSVPAATTGVQSRTPDTRGITSPIPSSGIFSGFGSIALEPTSPALKMLAGHITDEIKSETAGLIGPIPGLRSKYQYDVGIGDDRAASEFRKVREALEEVTIVLHVDERRVAEQKLIGDVTRGIDKMRRSQGQRTSILKV